jgi:predicted  nucleic acid-binding Zn-ribbon protein
MKTKDEFANELKAKIDEWSSKIDELEMLIAMKTGEAKMEFENKLENLKSKKSEAQKNLEELSAVSEAAFKEIKKETEKILDSAEDTLKKITDLFKR